MIAHLLTVPDPKDKNKFNEKVAMMPNNQFDGINNGGSWNKRARNYFISKAIEMDYLLRTAEASEDREITTQVLQATTSTWIPPDRVHFLSIEL